MDNPITQAHVYGLADAKFGSMQQLVALGPLLIITATVLLLIAADVACRLMRRKGGLGLEGSAVLSLLGALAAMGSAGYLLAHLYSSRASNLAQMFFAYGAPASAEPSRLASRPALTLGAWSGPALVVDSLGLEVCLIAGAILALTIVVFWPYLRRLRLYKAELFPLLLISGIGIMLLGLSRDLIVTFISIEILSLPLYVLCGLDGRREASREAALKYFLLGAFASGFFIYGAALVYGVAGHLNYSGILNYFKLSPDPNHIGLIGVGLIGVGLAFKLALVPFQAWLPDVYQGAPAPLVAFMASGVKLGIFAATLRFINDTLTQLDPQYWRLPLTIFAVASMVVGNLFALHQSSLKRLLAYSAITHSGYLALALCVGGMTASTGMLVYLVAYYLASFGAFMLIAYLAPEGQDDVYLDELHELSRRAPGTAAALLILLMSMIGMPLTAGFIGKLMVFTDAWRAGLEGLVIVAVLNSVVSAYFYLRVIMAAFFQSRTPGAPELELRPMARGYALAGAVTVGLTLVFGILPDLLLFITAAPGSTMLR